MVHVVGLYEFDDDSEVGEGRDVGEVPLGPLHIAAAAGHLRACELLLLACAQDPAEVNPTTGATPLHYACRSGKVDVVRFLLEYPEARASVNLQDYVDRMTPLHFSAHLHHTEIVRLLTNLTRADAIGVRCALGGAELTGLDIARRRHLTGWVRGRPEWGEDDRSSGAQTGFSGEEIEELLKRCNVCRKMRAGIICYRCGLALYCSADCQRIDWRKHKNVCVSKNVRHVHNNS